MRLARLWCSLAWVAAVGAYRPTRSLPATGRHRGALVTLCDGGDAQEWPPPSVWLQQAGAMYISAAILGPVCDGRHSAHDVLHYASDSIAGPPLLLQVGGQLVLETCWWVPLAFGGAAELAGCEGKCGSIPLSAPPPLVESTALIGPVNATWHGRPFTFVCIRFNVKRRATARDCGVMCTCSVGYG